MAIWPASIHYNTDNIHFHIAVVEPNHTRKSVKEQGKIKVTTFNKMKSKAVNEILDMSRQHEKINKLIREDIIKNREEKLFSKDKELNKLFKEIHSKLPKDKRMWQYNMNALHEIRPLIDKLSTSILIPATRKNITS